ncbi:histidine phosphotransferase family protein [Pararhodobacter aggregans]|uniref:histidine phosphotransferase family protein n=1 Tax=Pararhodobacter aggregans TaxID=404875 RepID=UPI003A95C9A6
MSASDLAALVGSRLCHDLVSPLGAIGNGVELLKMLHEGSDELALIEQAVAAAQARVRLYRLAFGAAHPGQEAKAEDLAEALQALSLNGRLTVECGLRGPLPRVQAKRLALAALCLETALPWGGTAQVTGQGVSARAPRMKLDPALWEALATGTPPEAPAAATVHFALLAEGGAVAVTRDEGGIAISL